MRTPHFSCPPPGHPRTLITLALGACFSLAACGGSSSEGPSDGGSDGMPSPGADGGAGPGADTGTSGPGSDGAASGADGGYPSGWLYTSGNSIMLSNGSTGTQWMGRGVNVDDIFLCGYNNTLYLTDPDTVDETVMSGLIAGWKPNFVRISLSMMSYTTTVSWLSDPAQYQTPVINVINALGKNPGVYVLVTLRSDASMMVGDPGNLDPTWIPSDSLTTPNASTFPQGTDPLYVSLVDTFAHASFVMFGLSNEPGGSAQSDATISAAMNHAVGTIRAEEDKLGVPHHIVSVQGNGYTSDLQLYTVSPSPITHDNVVYELHYYPGLGGETPSNYQVAATLPMIVGEYGDFTSAVPQSGFYADMESMHIPNLAWDFEPYSNCAPDLLDVTHSDTQLEATAWGTSVQAYLTAHAM
jgi:hypothetical protein